MREINWDYVGDAVPAFITIIVIPLSYKCVPSLPSFYHVTRTNTARANSIAYGVIAGVVSYILLNGIPGAIRMLTRGRIVPPNIDAAEPWVIPPGGLVPIWFQKLTGRYVDPGEGIEHGHEMEHEMGQVGGIAGVDRMSRADVDVDVDNLSMESYGRSDRSMPKHSSFEMVR